VAVYFLDSSALVKRYAQETGSAWVEALTAPPPGNTLYLARITTVEIVAAVTRRQRGETLTAADTARALADFHYDLAHQYRLIEITASLITHAMQLAGTYALRGYDAVQLAAALTVHTAREARGMSRLRLVSADRELNAAAIAEALMVEDPNTH
jgi:predicted nucleic acid-binding protein